MTRQLALSLALLVATFVLGTAAPVSAQVVELSGPSDFSGAETVLDFEDPSFYEGLAVPQFPLPPATGAVTLALEDENGMEWGGGASWGVALEPRPFDPQAPGSLNNFGGAGLPYPFPMVRFDLPEVMHRVSFDVRANVADEVVVIFRLAGAEVDRVTLPSPSSDSFHFRGFERAGGFDQVLVDATENFTGALAVDNLRYESLGTPPQEDPPTDPPAEEPPGEEDPGPGEELPDVPGYVCEGFWSPGSQAASRWGDSRWGRFGRALLKHLPFRLLRAEVVDHHGVAMAWHDLDAPPVLRVMHTPVGSDETHDVTDQAVRRNANFRYRDRGFWQKLVGRKAFRAPGTYVMTMETGDSAEYSLEPCVEWRVVEPPPEKRGRHSWMSRWRSRFGGR